MDREFVGDRKKLHSLRTSKIARKIAAADAVAYVMSSVRIAYGVGWKIHWWSNCSASIGGLGYLMLRAEVTGETAMVFASCFAIVIIFVAGEKLVIDPLAQFAVLLTVIAGGAKQSGVAVLDCFVFILLSNGKVSRHDTPAHRAAHQPGCAECGRSMAALEVIEHASDLDRAEQLDRAPASPTASARYRRARLDGRCRRTGR